VNTPHSPHHAAVMLTQYRLKGQTPPRQQMVNSRLFAPVWYCTYRLSKSCQPRDFTLFYFSFSYVIAKRTARQPLLVSDTLFSIYYHDNKGRKAVMAIAAPRHACEAANCDDDGSTQTVSACAIYWLIGLMIASSLRSAYFSSAASGQCRRQKCCLPTWRDTRFR